MAAHSMPRSEGASRSAPQASTLERIDELTAQSSGGLLAVDGDSDELTALAHHIARRAELVGRRCIVVDGRCVDEPWRDAAALIGVTPVEAGATARALVRALGGALLVVREAHTTHWGSAVADELAQQLGGSNTHGVEGGVVILTARRSPLHRQLTLTANLGERDMHRFWETLIEASRPRVGNFDRLDQLERWWSGGAAGERARAALLSKEARALHGRIALARQACDAALVDSLGPLALCDELVDARWLRREAGRLVLTEPALRTDERLLLSVAESMLSHADDMWSRMRAAELLYQAGEQDAAHDAALMALDCAPDAAARADAWIRIAKLLTSCDAERLSRYASRALALSDVEQALTLARRAAGEQRAQTHEVALTLGRATRARGDAPAAAAALSDAVSLAENDEQRASAQVELAELELSLGNREAATTHAQAAETAASSACTRLAARNVLGKVLLSEARWSDAERHFARDENDAACAGLSSDALRARLNRAIAVMSRGCRAEARALFESILAEGEATGERRATAFALANLSTYATLDHDYGHAMVLLERAIDEVRVLGDGERLARLILNLVDLRLRVGMVAEAEQALAFARQACGSTVLGSLVALLSFVTARVRLAAGSTLQASRDIRDAIGAAERSSNGAKLSETHRLAARIAVEDGDLRRAKRHLERARTAAGGPDSDADIAALAAVLARASGDDYLELAERALELAAEADDADLRRQSHVLSSTAYAALGNDSEARRHLEAAMRLRDAVGAGMSEAMRARYLARRDLAELADLQRRDQVALHKMGHKTGRKARNKPAARASSNKLVGDARAMRALCTAISKVGASDATVLIQGESGTGKELVADAIHAASERHRGPMVKVNCAALVETLLLSELFGHEKGSFTGAHSRKHGRFEQAHGGTIFLDEIGDISPKTQVALLRVLQERTIERVGAAAPIEVDVRVLCATHRDLCSMVAEGSFREDLYYRLCGVTLPVPALRERLDDLPALCRSLLARIAREQGDARPRSLTTEAIDGLKRHSWPGNVRELENALRAASLFAEGDAIMLRDLTENVAGLAKLGDKSSLPPSSHTRLAGESHCDAVYAEVRGGTSLPTMKRALERACIERALEDAGGNITKAAALLGMKRPRLSQLVNQYAREEEPNGPLRSVEVTK